MMNILKAFYGLFAAACIAIGVWAVVSYIDILSYDVNLPCNLFAWALEITA